MLQMTLHLTRSSRMWTFQLLEFEVFQVRLQKKAGYSIVSTEIHPLQPLKYFPWPSIQGISRVIMSPAE
jgi:hypothetical protein